jgi:hypothetical protein
LGGLGGTWKRELRFSRMCCGVMVAASRPAGPDATNSTASAVVMCSITTFRFGTYDQMHE